MGLVANRRKIKNISAAAAVAGSNDDITVQMICCKCFMQFNSGFVCKQHDSLCLISTFLKFSTSSAATLNPDSPEKPTGLELVYIILERAVEL